MRIPERAAEIARGDGMAQVAEFITKIEGRQKFVESLDNGVDNQLHHV